MPKVSQLNSLYPHDCKVLNAVREECKDWVWFHQGKYIQYVKPDWITKVYEHRLVAEKAYSIRLKRSVHVHHVNKNPSDNRACNLQVVSSPEHMSMHKGHRRNTECSYCKKALTVTAMSYKRSSRHFCNQNCWAKYQRESIRPSKQELEKVMTQVKTWRAMGKLYNVSDTAVRGWAKDYGLPHYKQKSKLLKVN